MINYQNTLSFLGKYSVTVYPLAIDLHSHFQLDRLAPLANLLEEGDIGGCGDEVFSDFFPRYCGDLKPCDIQCLHY